MVFFYNFIILFNVVFTFKIYLCFALLETILERNKII